MEVQKLKTGTTTVGVVAKEAVVLAADMRASMGHLAYDEESQKLYKITDEIALTNAGVVGDSLALIRFLRSQAQLYEIERETKITPNALAALLSNILNTSRFYPFVVQFLLGGVNKVPELFELEPFGGVLKRERYAASGSGTELALAILDQNYKKNMEVDDAVRVAVRAIQAGKKRDIYSGGVGISVMVIEKKGIKELSAEEVKKFMQKDEN
ncbi:MAG: proteasome subunit beta [Candidatus Diapherotrites archaeon]|nr:proteasome subunit beta [Candidatus Diapherotrites archaeon]